MSPEWVPPDGDDEPGRPDEAGPRRPSLRRPGGPRGPRGPRRRGALGPTLAILAVLAFLSSIAAELLTDLWWYDSVGFRSVYLTELGTRALIFVLAFLITAGAIGGSLYAAYRTRPLFVPTTPGQLALEQYRDILDPLRRLALFVVPGVFGLLAGSGSMGAWDIYLLWRNGVPFGTKDPQYGLDIGFYVFTLPWLTFLTSFFTVVLVLALLAGALTHYIYGGLQLPGRGPSSRAAYIHLSALGALLLLVRGGSAWLDRYSMTTRTNDLVSRTGMTYTDVHAAMPGKAILAMAAVVCALLFLGSIWTHSWRLPLVGVALFTVVGLVVGTLYPAAIQSFKAGPSRESLEPRYIKRNIDATRAAFGLDKVQPLTNPPASERPTVDKARLRADADKIPGIRIIDPNVVAQSFRQLQGKQAYYAFPDVLDIDRYMIDGQTHDAVVAVREINVGGLGAASRNWQTDHTIYTHGYGFYAAYSNRRTSQGDPEFFESGGSGLLGDYEPRVYFGELSPEYSIVGDGPGSKPREFDHPEGAGGSSTNTYAGKGGVALDSPIRRLAYAATYREANFLLSDAVNDHARLLDHRTPTERVQRVAPWLTLDGNVYPAVVGGRIVWIVEGFTTSSHYPSSRQVDLADATSDSVNERSNVVSVGAGQVNYVRNSVKATVDAYDGSVRLYGWDTKDPILRAWQKAFPGTVRDLSQMQGSLMSHIRYPQDLLKIQRDLYGRYRVTNEHAFFGGSDFWRIPRDPNQKAGQDQSIPVYFQSLTMPGQSAPAFSLTTPFVPIASDQAATDTTAGNGREILRGLLAVDADAGNVTGRPSSSYGAMRVLQFPTEPAGPGQVLNQIHASTVRSQNPTEGFSLAQYISNNSVQGKELIFGNLLSFPFDGGMLYVQPLYIRQGSGSGTYPQNKANVVVFDDMSSTPTVTVAWGDTLSQALDGVFGTTGSSGTGGGGTTPTTGTAAQQVRELVKEMQSANAAAQDALKKGDFAAYGAAQKRLQAALSKLSALTPRLDRGAAAPKPSPSPSPSK